MELGVLLSQCWKEWELERTILDHHTMRETTTYIMFHAGSNVAETSKKHSGFCPF
jgi:hypothetical protein